MGGKRKSKPKKKTKAQKMAVANKAKYGGTASAAKANKASMKAKAKSYTKTSGAATAAAKNKASMQAKAKAKHTASQAAKKAAPSKGASISKGTTGIGPVKSGKTYSRAVSNATNAPTKKTSGIGPYADGAKYAAALKASPPVAKAKFKSAPLVAEAPKKINPFNIFQTKEALKEGEAAREGVRPEVKNPGFLDSILNRNSETQRMINELSAAPQQTDTLVAAAGNLGGLGISPADTGPNYFKIKSPESFGAPSQEAVDKAAGITAGGLNIGGSGFTPSSPSGGANARAIFPGASPNSVLNDPNFTPGPVAGDPFAQPGPGGPEPESDYTSYQPGSFYNQSDTNMNPTNFLRSARNVVTTPARMLGINNQFTNMLIPKSNEAIQDARDQRGPRPTLKKRGGGGGARLPVAPLTPEEILLPEETAVAQTVPDYQQAQTGVDPNRLMQIQQEAYLQAFNPSYNPMFRFFGRRGMGRGSFRKAFRRRD